jgi:hypothetical protein
MRKLKLIWDFRGPDAHKIAEHHESHLKEYVAINTVSVDKTGVEYIHELHAIAFMVVDESDMKPIRDALKPHRGQVYQHE